MLLKATATNINYKRSPKEKPRLAGSAISSRPLKLPMQSVRSWSTGVISAN